MLTSILAGLTILMVGDSHLMATDGLIDSLHMELVQEGAQVHSIGVCGTDAEEWLKAMPGSCGASERTGTGPIKRSGPNAMTTPITDLIAQDKPDLVVLVMGDTMAAYSKDAFPKAWVWQQVTGLTKAISGTKTACVWVGPAWGTEGGKYQKTFTRARQTAAFLSRNVSPCDYIDSLKFSEPGAWATIDGVHFLKSGYEQWSSAIAKALPATPVVKALVKSKGGGQ